ncbi:hypothetical protein FACS189490_04890 [Clostridia bacterium]|nr:hypothetical protein FACS189490_04890 [Clostridia bacterium]
MNNFFKKSLSLTLMTVIFLSACSNNATPASSQKTTRQKAAYGDLILGLGSDGRVALPVSNLNFEVEGTVKEIYVSVGDAVKEGDLLAELDDSDYAFSITSAQNNLTKAQTAYDNAVSQYDYSTKNDDKTIAELERTIAEGFDSYTYDTAIEDAQTALIRRQTDYEKALEKIADPFDPYTYDNQIKEAEKTLASRQSDFDEAEADLDTAFDDYSYKNQIAEAEITLNRREADLLQAQADLEEAKAKDLSGFDDYTYKNQIADAQTALDRRKKELADAQKDASVNSFDSYSYDKQIETAKTNVLRRKDDLNTAKNDYDKALSDNQDSNLYYLWLSYDNANKALAALKPEDPGYAEALAKVQQTQQTYYEAAEKQNAAQSQAATAADAKVKAAQQAYDDAVKAENNAREELTRARENYVKNADTKVTAAEQAVTDAEKTLATAKSNLSRAQSQYAKDAEDSRESTVKAAQAKVDSAQNVYDDAMRSLNKLNADYERAASQNAEDEFTKYKNAKTALTNAEEALEKAKTDKTRAQTDAIDSSVTQLTNAETALSDAKTALEKAKTNKTRARQEHAKKVEDAEKNLELQKINAGMNKNANSSIAAAEFTLQEAKLNLEKAEKNLNKTRLYATKDGQILSISKSKGEKTAASQNIESMIFGTGASGSAFLTLCDTREIYLKASITEGDIAGVTVGQTIKVTIDAIGGEDFYGAVSNVDSIPSTDSSGITTYGVTLKLNDTSDVIKDGMNAYITFIKKENKNVLLIPNKAVFIENEMQYVNIVKDDDTYEKRKVVCGLSNGVQTEVLDGVTAGETVLVGKVTGA